MASSFQYQDGQLFLAKHQQPLTIRWSRPLPSVPTTVTVSKDATGNVKAEGLSVLAFGERVSGVGKLSASRVL